MILTQVDLLNSNLFSVFLQHSQYFRYCYFLRIIRIWCSINTKMSHIGAYLQPEARLNPGQMVTLCAKALVAISLKIYGISPPKAATLYCDQRQQHSYAIWEPIRGQSPGYTWDRWSHYVNPDKLDHKRNDTLVILCGPKVVHGRYRNSECLFSSAIIEPTKELFKYHITHQ